MAIRRPRRHECPDCGQKHRRPEEDRKAREHWTRCLHCGEKFYGDYSVLSDVWRSAGLKVYAGTCHLHCLEELLERPLTPDDLAPLPVNNAIFHMLRRAS